MIAASPPSARSNRQRPYSIRATRAFSEAARHKNEWSGKRWSDYAAIGMTRVFDTPIQDRGLTSADAMSARGDQHMRASWHPRVGNLVDTSFRPGTRDAVLPW